jgi:uncharacterized protein YdgA (DUF945 family)
MKKVGLAAILIVALVLLVLPPALGTWTQRQMQSRLQAMRDGGMTAELKSYRRGWFTSRAKIELGLPGPVPGDAAGSRPRTATLIVDFAHGPIIVHDGLFLGLSKMTARLDPDTDGVGAIEQRLGLPHLVEFRARTGLGGGVTFDADVPAIDLPLADTRLKFSGAALAGTFRDRRLVSSFEVGSVAFATPSGTFGLENLTARIDNEVRSKYVLPGTFELSLGHVVLADAAAGGAPLLELSNLRAASVTAVDGNGARLGIETSYSAQSVRIEGMQFADANIGLTAHNIDVAAMQSYFDAAARHAATGDARERAEALEALAPVIERGLAAGPSLELDPVRFSLNDAPLDARAVLAVDPSALPPTGTLDLEDPSLWLSIVRANATVRIGKSLARQIAVAVAQQRLGDSMPLPPADLHDLAKAQAEIVLATLAGRGLLRSDGDDYRTEIELTDGLLTVNGTALPLN